MVTIFFQNEIRKRLTMKSNIAVALAAFWVNFCLLGVLRSNAVIYKALVDVYEVSRETAAWPSGIFGFTMCVTGALSGFLTYHFSLRHLAMFGVLLASSAVSISSFATNMSQIGCLYGALQGIGVGMIVPLTHVVLNQNFTKYKAFALGIAYSGSSAGSFLFPPLTNLLLAEYGLGGTFLLLGGIMLNALIGALLFRSPTRDQRNKKLFPRSLKPEQTKPYQQPLVVLNESSITKNDCYKPVMTNDANNHKESISQPIIPSDCTKKSSIIAQDGNVESRKKLKKVICPQMKSSLKMAAEILWSPHFFIVSAAYAIYFSTSAIFLMVILDFAKDRGVSLQEGVYLVSAFSLGDCAGRLSFGWIADAQFVARNILVRLYLLSMGLLTGLLVHTPVSLLPLVSVLLGVLNGSVIVNHSVLLNEYLGLDKLPLAVGFSMFLIGMTAMLRPMAIGFFRDRNQSYDHLFTFIGFLQVSITALWFLGSLVQSIRKRYRAQNKSVQ